MRSKADQKLLYYYTINSWISKVFSDYELNEGRSETYYQMKKIAEKESELIKTILLIRIMKPYCSL